MKTESGSNRPILGELLEVLINSDRIVIYDGENDTSTELYRGYVGCFCYAQNNIDTSRRIAKTGLGTDIFRREQGSSHIYNTEEEKKKIPMESISDFKYSDLEEIIYTRIFLEVTG